VILTTRDYLEQSILVSRSRTSYTLQEATEHLLHFGALLRARILDTFGSLLYVYYDEFSVAEVEALHKVYRDIFERRYDVFHLVPGILRNPDMRASWICSEIYAHAGSCLKSSANVCRRIKRRHDLPRPDTFHASFLNTTYLVYHSSKISKHYLKGFSLSTILKLLQREVLTLTPGLLSGFLHNVRYNNFDDDIRLAERELVQYFREVTTHSGKYTHSTEIIRTIPMNDLKKFYSVSSFLRYYIGIHIDRFTSVHLKRHASLLTKRIIDDIDIIDENIQLLGNVYENRTIHVQYLFDLVLPDDVLDKDMIEAKRYLLRKLKEFNVVEGYLKIQRYIQSTPAQLVMEITGQLRDINFVRDIATSLRMHARFWHRSVMIESLDELLELFDAYENLRVLPHYREMMVDVDILKKTLWEMRDVPVEILCSSPRACLRLGLQLVLECKFVSTEIKTLIVDFLRLSEECLACLVEQREHLIVPHKIARTSIAKAKSYVEQSSIADILMRRTTSTESTAIRRTRPRIKVYQAKESAKIIESVEAAHKIRTGKVIKPQVFIEKSTENVVVPTRHVEQVGFGTVVASSKRRQVKERARIVAARVKATMTRTTATVPTMIVIPTTTSTTTAAPTTTTTLPTTTTTIMPTTTTTTTELPTTTTTELPTTTTTTELPTTTTTELPTTTTTELPTTTTTTTMPTTTLPTTTTTLPTVIMTIPTTTVTRTVTPRTIIMLRRESTEQPIVTMKLKRSRMMAKKASTTLQTIPGTTSCNSYECLSKQTFETSRYKAPALTMTMIKENVTWVTTPLVSLRLADS